jgi:hypothetical protein
VKEDEEFEHIERDEARLTELRELEPEARDGDEFNSLEKHVAAYHEAVRVAHEKRTQPRRDALLAKDREDLVNDIREERITADGNAVFNLYFSLHEVLNGTFYAETYTKGDGTPGVRPGKRYFSSITEVQTADPNLLDALTDAFSNLESSFASRFSGNS